MRINTTLKRRALALSIALATSASVYAQSNTQGSIYGDASSGTVTVENLATGSRRVIGVEGGSFRASSLPTGRYRVTYTGADGSTSSREVNVSVGTGSRVDFAEGTTLATIEVGADSINPIDLSSTESATNLTAEQVDRVPVPRDVTSVALLAPGTVRGDLAFGNLASFGGSSVAENAYFINGFNVTNVFQGIAYSQLPFTALAETQVKTGGYGAEFGRSTGGVVNMITKSGSNDWAFGGNAFFTPSGLSETGPDNYRTNGTLYNRNENETFEELTYALYASGPVIQDRLFFYALYEQGGSDFETASNESLGRYTVAETDNPTWLTKIDWNISDNHLVELTAFSDKRQTDGKVYFQNADFEPGAFIGTTAAVQGGTNIIGKYTGYLTDNFTLSALVGSGKYDRTNLATKADGSAGGCPLVIDVRTNGDVHGCWLATTQTRPDSADERLAYRIDGEWMLGDSHRMRFGYDRDEWNTVAGTEYSGSEYWRYINATPGAALPNGGITPAGVTQVVRRRVFQNFAIVDTYQSAFYVEDNWQMSDNFMAYLGLRMENFDNRNVSGESFVKVNNQIAPRLGMTWDAKSDGSLKVFGNAGRYHLPVAANTNVRAAGPELDYQEFYSFTGIDPISGAPSGLTAIGGRRVTSPGITPNPLSVADQNLSPMYQDEYIAGFQTQLAEGWTGGVRAIHRNLGNAIDDTCSHLAFERWAERNNINDFDDSLIPTCILFNPGNDITVDVDVNADGTLEQVHLSADDLRFTDVIRRYNAVEFFFERGFDEKWFLQGSWTIAHSYGNTEGYVKSDIGQADAGVTQDWDFPELQNFAYGDLPNDRRHSLKLFGAYQLNDEWRLGGNLLVQSGRPRNCIGHYDNYNDPNLDPAAALYGAAFFYCDGQPTPRASRGRGSWMRQLDLNVAYHPAALDGKLGFKVDVFNVFNADAVTNVIELGEDLPGVSSADFNTPTQRQPARFVRASVQYDF